MKSIDINIIVSNKTLTFSIMANKCSVICSANEEEVTHILRKIGRLDDCSNLEKVVYNTQEEILNISYFFKQGILLSNLSLMENIELPFKYFCPQNTWNLYRERINKWTEYFCLNIDFDKRPSDISYSEKKIVSYIRNIILEPDVYLINDPFFQLSYVYRKKMVDCLMLLKDNNNILTVGSSDFDLIAQIADVVILIDKGEVIDQYEIMGNNREKSLSSIRGFLDKCQV
jgi:ABC-type multidrug transport system ATPase subunit